MKFNNLLDVYSCEIDHLTLSMLQVCVCVCVCVHVRLKANPPPKPPRPQTPKVRKTSAFQFVLLLSGVLYDLDKKL